MSTVRKGQIYRSKRRDDFCVEIIGKRGGKWRSRVLTENPKLFNGSHTLSETTIRHHYTLVDGMI